MTRLPEPLRPLLVTHSGTFHLDDASAYAVLRLALGLGAAGRDHALVRTRDEAVVAGADVAWDVGAVHDPAAGSVALAGRVERAAGALAVRWPSRRADG